MFGNPLFDAFTKLANMNEEERERFFKGMAEKEQRDMEARARDWEEYKRTVPEIPLVHKKEIYGNDYAECTTVVRNRYGFYPTRTSSLFVSTANRFNSKVQLKAKGKSIDAKSILMIASMGLVRGTEITISASGYDASEAVKTLVELIDSKFGEE